MDDVLAETVQPRHLADAAPGRLHRPTSSCQRTIGLVALRGYLVVALALVVVKIVEVAIK